MARSAKQIASQLKASKVSAAKRRKKPTSNAEAYATGSPRPYNPHPNESLAGTKLYGLRKSFESAKPGPVRNQLLGQLKRARREYWS